MKTVAGKSSGTYVGEEHVSPVFNTHKAPFWKNTITINEVIVTFGFEYPANSIPCMPTLVIGGFYILYKKL